MKKFEEKKFNIRELKGISAKNIEEHLKLYSGYVKNANVIMEKFNQMWTEDKEKNQYAISEITRRFSFEYNGIRNHEIYFESLSVGATPLSDGPLKKAIEDYCGSLETFLSIFKNIAMTRGIGWAVLWYDRKDKRLLASWVDEQHLGQLNSCEMILALDMWEHAYIYDYPTSEKKKYIETFFENLNWGVVEKNFIAAQ